MFGGSCRKPAISTALPTSDYSKKAQLPITSISPADTKLSGNLFPIINLFCFTLCSKSRKVEFPKSPKSKWP